jgi:hypothetical protein
VYQPPDDGRRVGSSVPYAEVNAHSADGFLDGASIAGGTRRKGHRLDLRAIARAAGE